MRALLLIGGGGHCRSCIDVVEAGRQFEVAGIVDNEVPTGTLQLGHAILGTDDDLPELVKRFGAALVTVGQIKSASVRIRLFGRLRELGAELPSITSPLAYVSRHARIMAGSIVMHGALVNAQASIGENCILNSQALIEHDVQVGSHCHVSTGAKINGGVRIGTGSFVGSGAVVREGVRIGDQCVIGAGAIVTRDVADGTLVRGRYG